MASIDLARWNLWAEQQLSGSNYCWAAALSSITRFVIQTKFITQADFVFCGLSEAKTTEPGWEAYVRMSNAITQKGMQAMGSHGKMVHLTYRFDMRSAFDLPLIRREIGAGRPVIVTVKHPQKEMAHDVVIVAIDYRADVAALMYWNPEDGGIGEFSLDGFQREFTPSVTTALLVEAA